MKSMKKYAILGGKTWFVTFQKNVNKSNFNFKLSFFPRQVIYCYWRVNCFIITNIMSWWSIDIKYYYYLKCWPKLVWNQGKKLFICNKCSNYAEILNIMCSEDLNLNKVVQYFLCHVFLAKLTLILSIVMKHPQM